MDMWDPYVASTREHLDESEKKIVYDKYHIAAHLAKAVDQVRRAENKRLLALGDERLTGTKYAWLRHPANFSEDAWREFRALRESDLKTARAWALKETAMRLFDYRRESAARAFFEQWRGWASRSRLTPMVTVARMLTARLENILTYLKHRITNAVSEGLNSRIQWVKATARGFRNQQSPIRLRKCTFRVMCLSYPLLQAKTDRPTGRSNEFPQLRFGSADSAKEQGWEHFIVIFGPLQVAS